MPIIAALTGSIGSGKSEAAKIFERLGAQIIDADKLSRAVVAPGSEGLASILYHFGEHLALSDGSLDRSALGKIIFTNSEQRSLLESILHPLINKLFKSELARAIREHAASNLIIYVVPLYFESRLEYPEIEKVVVVAATKEVCIKRIMARDGCDLEFAEKKLQSQMPIEQKMERADFVINNNGSINELESEVKAIYQDLITD